MLAVMALVFLVLLAIGAPVAVAMGLTGAIAVGQGIGYQPST